MKWFLRTIFTLLLLAGWVGVAYLYVDYTLESPKRDHPVFIEINEDSTLKKIGEILKKNHLIREDWFFRFYAVFNHRNKLFPGVYRIDPNKNLDQILAILANADRDLNKVTIPEGKTALEIAAILKKKGYDSNGFLKAVNKKQAEYQFEQDLNAHPNPKRVYKLEGYLFPSTYQFQPSEEPSEIVSTMLKVFASQMDELNARDRLRELHLTVDQWVTIASIIEREGRVSSELPRIAGVIYNRMRLKMPLTVDASVIYAWELKGVKKKRLVHKDLSINSPYNSYMVKGLPPGPICNPGLKSLKAALYPEKNNYLYYVTKSDGTFEHYFATNPEQHNKNIALSNANEAKMKKNKK